MALPCQTIMLLSHVGVMVVATWLTEQLCLGCQVNYDKRPFLLQALKF